MSGLPGPDNGIDPVSSPSTRVVVERYTDIVGPSLERLGPVALGGQIEFRTVPGCWGPMITPELRSGHEVTLPVAVDGVVAGDAVVLTVVSIRSLSLAATSGTDSAWEGRYVDDPTVAAICPSCKARGMPHLRPRSRLEGIGDDAVRCLACGSSVAPVRMRHGYTMLFDDRYPVGITVDAVRAAELAKNGREVMGISQHALQHPSVSLARTDLVGMMARCRLSVGNLGCIPAIDMPSSHNCGDFGASLVNAAHDYGITADQLLLRTDAHMDIAAVREGSVLVVPAKVDGGGIYAGDVHAMIGAGEIAGHATDIAAEVVVNVESIPGLFLEGPILIPRVEDLPYLARPFSRDEIEHGAALAGRNRTPLEPSVLPIQVLGSGPWLNEAVDNAICRAARLLDLKHDEIRNRATVTGGVEIGRLPGFVQLSLQVPVDHLDSVGLGRVVRQSYGQSD